MREVFTEVVMAPAFTEEALAAFAERPNLRVVRAPLEQPARLGRAHAARRRARAGLRRGP